MGRALEKSRMGLESRHLPHGLLLGLLLGCFGCGGDPEPEPAAQNPAVDIKKVEIAAPQVAAVAAPAAAPASNAAPAPAKAAAAPASPDAFSLYNPVYAIVGQVPRAEPVLVAVVDPIAKGVNSSSFEIAGGAERGTGALELPAGFEIVPNSGVSADGLPLRIRHTVDQAEMALVPAGVFTRGIADGPANSRPQAVYLDAFYMDVHEVTLKQYDAFREMMKEKKRRTQAPLNSGEDPNLPVLGITWGEARYYARTVGKTLPTEAQWEKAARGTKAFQYPWGNDRPLWSRPRQKEDIAPVQSFAGDMSPYGISDLAGNGREWCLDWYSNTIYSEREPSQATVRNPLPKVATESGQRVVRGGGDDWSVWHRGHEGMSDRLADVGFRGVLTLRSDNTVETGADADDAAEPPAEEPAKPAKSTKPAKKPKVGF